MSAHLCDTCQGETVYQVFSGGKEWYCPHCGCSGEYPADQTPRRLKLLQSEAGRTALRAEMGQELARRRDQT